ncbi:MAG TPA: response regulator transcription factor [Longimicrobium sp.]|jgi:two-component system alkaline phosphatase synthesis response regulator PhoP|nr:response regulator transcription factor [Longimicrobium sp.]
MPELLLVEDNASLILTLRDRLTNAGYFVAVQRDGVSAIEAATSHAFDCILLDIGLPEKNGLEVCRELRRRNVLTPILMLSARDHVMDRVQGLKLGADDYLTKPFEMVELLARVEALLRRRPAPAAAAMVDVYTLGDVTFDARAGEVRRGGEPVELSDLELRLLRYLVERRGTAVTRDELLAKVWQHDELPLTRTVDVRIASLRQKLERDPAHPALIVTVHGVGYKLVG